MKIKKRCLACRCRFTVMAHVPNQRYCSNKKCQLTRKNRWKQQRLKSDPDYQSNQKSAQQKWQLKNPDYWRAYRAVNPEYTQRNRAQSKKRSQLKVKQPICVDKTATSHHVAKSDASLSINDIKTMGYSVLLVSPSEFAKSDASSNETINLSIRCTGKLGDVTILQRDDLMGMLHSA